MPHSTLLPCDGCGQLAAPAHIARRLQRLEWATRFRPVHIQTLLLSGIAPRHDTDFLYSPQSSFQGEACTLLQAIEISTEEKSHEAVLSEFQKLGFMLTHVLECPLEEGVSPEQARALLEKQLPATIARIRRSFKPKRILLLSAELQQLAHKFLPQELACTVLPAAAGTFLSSSAPAEVDLQAFRAALAGSHA